MTDEKNPQRKYCLRDSAPNAAGGPKGLSSFRESRRDGSARSKSNSRYSHQQGPRASLSWVGPCSIHDLSAAKEYASLLRELATKVQDSMVLIMRVYFEKPRTTIGWKGFINDPHLDNSFRIEEGLYKARELLLELAEMGLLVGTEALDPLTPQYSNRSGLMGCYWRTNDGISNTPRDRKRTLCPRWVQKMALTAILKLRLMHFSRSRMCSAFLG